MSHEGPQRQGRGDHRRGQRHRTGVGRALCQRLKQWRGTPVLCISSLDLGEQALAAGADAFLKKPLEPLQLAATVKDLLGQQSHAR